MDGQDSKRGWQLYKENYEYQQSSKQQVIKLHLVSFLWNGPWSQVYLLRTFGAIFKAVNAFIFTVITYSGKPTAIFCLSWSSWPLLQMECLHSVSSQSRAKAKQHKIKLFRCLYRDFFSEQTGTKHEIQWNIIPSQIHLSWQKTNLSTRRDIFVIQ